MPAGKDKMTQVFLKQLFLYVNQIIVPVRRYFLKMAIDLIHRSKGIFISSQK